MNSRRAQSLRMANDGRCVDPKKVWRKMDICIVPFTAFLYLLTFLDRTNIGNARVAGLQEDLGLTNYQYTVALTVTNVPYILVEIPSNLLLRTIGPNILLPALLSAWGVVSALQGIVTSFRQLLVCRFFIGLLEGGAYPGFVLYLSLFYPGENSQNRRNHRVLWFGAFWVMPKDVMSTKFLTHEERVYVAELVKEAERPEKAKLNWRGVLKAVCISLNALAYFAPSIVQSLGYSAARTQLMVVPPYAVSFAVAMVTSYVADRYNLRGLILQFSYSLWNSLPRDTGIICWHSGVHDLEHSQ
ncbi:MFS general substrate transporter [Hymenopellis radicata]|nr:MFS general substrate transporter [Hymenopellis radicata]